MCAIRMWSSQFSKSVIFNIEYSSIYDVCVCVCVTVDVLLLFRVCGINSFAVSSMFFFCVYRVLSTFFNRCALRWNHCVWNLCERISHSSAKTVTSPVDHFIVVNALWFVEIVQMKANIKSRKSYFFFCFALQYVNGNSWPHERKKIWFDFLLLLLRA